MYDDGQLSKPDDNSDDDNACYGHGPWRGWCYHMPSWMDGKGRNNHVRIRLQLFCLLRHGLDVPDHGHGCANGHANVDANGNSSVHSNNNNAHGQSELGSTSAWVPQTNNAGEWMQIDLGNVTAVAQIVTQGRKDYDQWVKSYKVQHSVDGLTFTEIASTVFVGNSDRNTKVNATLPTPVFARYVRLLPQTYQGHQCMRAGVVKATSCPAPPPAPDSPPAPARPLRGRQTAIQIGRAHV